MQEAKRGKRTKGGGNVESTRGGSDALETFRSPTERLLMLETVNLGSSRKNFSFWCENETRYYNAERIRLDKVGDVHGHLLDLGVVELLDFPQHRDVLGGNKVDRNTLSAESTTSTDSVDVVLLARGQVVVDNERNLLNIDTSGEQVGRDQDSG